MQTNLLGYTPSRGSNKNLIKLLKESLNLELKDTYATNLFPYIKMGKMSAKIKPTDMSKAAKEFTLPMIDIIKPKIAIALTNGISKSRSTVCCYFVLSA